MPLNTVHRIAHPELAGKATPQPALELVWNQRVSVREQMEIKTPRLLRLTVAMLLLSTAVSYGFEGFWTWVGMQYPYTSPLVARISYFDDLLDWVGHMHLMHTAAFLYTPGMVSYTAPGMVLYWLLSLAGNHALAAYLVMVAVIAGATLLAFGRRLRQEGLGKLSIAVFLGVVTLTSYPLLFTITTANLEIAVTALMLGGVWAFATGRHGIAATLIGVAIAMKFYPAALLLLYVQRREWLRILQTGLSAITATLVSLWAVYPNIPESWRAIYGASGATANFVKDDVLTYHPGRSGFDHAFWSLWKVVTSPFTYTHSNLEMMIVNGIAAAAILGLWVWRGRRLRLWENVTFLVSAMLLLMPMSNDYRLMALYVPFGLLVLAIMRGKVGGRLGIAAVALYSLLLTPQGFANWDGNRYAAQWKSFFLIFLLVAVAVWGRRANASVQPTEKTA